MRSSDTHPEVHERQVDAYRRMTAAQKAELVVEMSEQMRDIAREGIRRRHPTYDEQDVTWALQRAWLGDEVFRRAWPYAPFLAP